MGYLLGILSHSIGSVFLGLLLAALCVGLMLFLVSSWRRDVVVSAVGWVAGGLLLLLLTGQIALICGAVKVNSATDYYEELATEIIHETGRTAAAVTEGETGRVVDELTEQVPLLAGFVESGKLQVESVAELPHAIAEGVREQVRGFILRRVLWSLGFLAVGTVVVVKTMEGMGRRRGGTTRREAGRRSERSVGRRRR